MPNTRTVSIEQFRGPTFETSANLSRIKGIHFPEPSQMRSRRVVSRSNARSTGKYPSWKMGRMMHWESIHELNAFRLLDCDPNVTSYCEQPCQIVYVLDGVERLHYPDIIVTTTAGKQLWEVKLRSNASEPEVLARTAFLSRALPRWGYEYQTVFDEDLAKQPRLSNANLLLRLGKRAVNDCEWEGVRRTLAEQGELLWSEATSDNYGAKGREILLSLVLRGILTIDMDSPISSATEFVPKNGSF
ncbi:TnsA endonuclease N-terminal domain-containing protein [Edaphobacter aggregans]|uniref:TnsA endonuclease N-terminal domain-containing protein n=1 Tax=Edaphobacter aggregans TaxID=570835 RepID=UPI001C8BB0DD|nr:TnsA endonuclease N-terminal domain-containing protein [Edaphobacter aggregans]